MYLYLAPSSPKKVVLTSDDPKCVTLSWSKPDYSNGDIISYQVSQILHDATLGMVYCVSFVDNKKSLA